VVFGLLTDFDKITVQWKTAEHASVCHALFRSTEYLRVFIEVYRCTRCSEKTTPFVLQYISNIPKPIQMKFTTVVALKLQLAFGLG